MWLHEFVARGEYNEPEVLKAYVRHNCRDLMSEFERLAEPAVASRNQDLIASLTGMLKERHRHEDPAVVKALGYGHEQFMQAVIDRILRTHRDKIALCRCPKCRRIAATPRAHQCLWCGADWHAHQSDAATAR